jgi:hypothetical protein
MGPDISQYMATVKKVEVGLPPVQLMISDVVPAVVDKLYNPVVMPSPASNTLTFAGEVQVPPPVTDDTVRLFPETSAIIRIAELPEPIAGTVKVQVAATQASVVPDNDCTVKLCSIVKPPPDTGGFPGKGNICGENHKACQRVERAKKIVIELPSNSESRSPV